MIETTDHGAIRELRLARPPANALNPALIVALADAVERAPEEGIGALVISGRPGMFSGGLDVPELLALDRPAMLRVLTDFFRLMRVLAASRLPIVAAITGHAPAGGAVVSLFCDRRVMADGDFKIGLNEVQVGLSLPQVIHTAAVRVVGAREAERLAVAGLLIPAGDALRIGLVDELVPPGQVVERALEICRDLLRLPRRAMRVTRELCRRELLELFDAQQEATFGRFVDDWFSEETQGALGALVERLKKRG